MSWPACSFETRPWRQSQRAGGQSDRRWRVIAVTVPPLIADLSVELSANAGRALQQANRQIELLAESDLQSVRGLGALVLRSESVASSRIELVEATLDDYARAFHGSRANRSATEMVSATRAIDRLLTRVEDSGRIRIADLLSAHSELMQHDASERDYRGKFREVQIWVGGSDHSPRDAMFAPPPPELVPELMDDLLTFANRTDIDPLAQAAIAHAQFETIHPFTDGNGRIGRALINVILKQRGCLDVLIPIATALVARRGLYFTLLNDYRLGEVEQLVEILADAACDAAIEVMESGRQLAKVERSWWLKVSGDELALKVVSHFFETPIFTTEEAGVWLGAESIDAEAVMARLSHLGLVSALTSRVRNQVWGVREVLNEIENLGHRVAERSLHRQPNLWD